MHKIRHFPLILILGFLFSGNVPAKTWENNWLIPLTKITVGPWDNFDASITNDGRFVYFTRDRTQIPNIYRQDTLTNTASVFIGEEGDAKDPVLDASNLNLAITYYKFDSQGDVCIVKLIDKQIDCILSKNSTDEAPFWIDQNHLGYLSHTTQNLTWDLVVRDLTTKKHEILHTGFLSAPVASSNGRYIVFNQTESNGTVRLQAYDRTSKKLITPPAFDLSGKTGFRTLSKDGFLYFNHYLNDTNFDQIIDGNDNSVAFRIPFLQWLNAKNPILPEQLTSVSSNCKFPGLSASHLYLTCAFEGSLDIYRLPLTGSIPTHWDEKQLWEAHAAARSYEARLLILNTLRYRHAKNDQAMLERLLSNHLEIGELAAANHYINQLIELLKSQSNTQMVEFYQTLSTLLLVKSSKQRVPVGIVTARFQKLVSQQRQTLEQQKLPSHLITLINAYLDYELENYDSALQSLEKIDLTADSIPLQRYIAFELYRNLLNNKDPLRLLDQYSIMFNLKSMPLESKLYYAFQYMVLLSNTVTDLAARNERLQKQFDLANDEKIKDLILSELKALELASSHDEEKQKKAFDELGNLLKQNKDNQYVRKTLHTRAIQILGEAEQFNYMELLSRHWLTTTQSTEMEFFSAAEQYSVITMDKAYGMMSHGDLGRAYAVFYSAIRQTNDLEAHYQFVTLGLNPSLNKLDNLNKSYALLDKQNLTGQNSNYVQALRLVVDYTGSAKKDMKSIDTALTLLLAMQVSGLNPAMRDLLIGYIYHIKLRDTINGFQYDRELFKKAHYHYMMALDLGKENRRISVSLWENLAWLHFEIRHYALSADFFRKRSQYPFPDNDAEIRVRWALARSLFYNHELKEAYEVAQALLQLAAKDKKIGLMPYIEKTAYYAMQAGEYAAAIKLYAELLSDPRELEPHNLAKANLGYGYAFLKSKHFDLAHEKLELVLDICRTLPELPASKSRLVAFKPDRLRLLAFGFLANIAKNSKDSSAYRLERTRILTKMRGKHKQFAYEEATRLSLLAKDFQQIAILQELDHSYEDMSKSMLQSVLTAVKWAEETGNYAGPVMVKTLVNFLSMAVLHPVEFRALSIKDLHKTVTQVQYSISEQSFVTEFTIALQVKLAILWEAYQIRIDGQTDSNVSERIDFILQDVDIKRLKSNNPNLYNELEKIAKYF